MAMTMQDLQDLVRPKVFEIEDEVFVHVIKLSEIKMMSTDKENGDSDVLVGGQKISVDEKTWVKLRKVWESYLYETAGAQ
jgi:hypothetical protein